MFEVLAKCMPFAAVAIAIRANHATNWRPHPVCCDDGIGADDADTFDGHIDAIGSAKHLGRGRTLMYDSAAIDCEMHECSVEVTSGGNCGIDTISIRVPWILSRQSKKTN